MNLNLKELVKLDRLVTIAITLIITASITWTMNFNFQNTTINNYNQLNDTIDYRIGELENSTGLSDKQQIAYLKQILRDNLTSHRLVTNDTNTQIKELQNQTNILISQFNKTNEVEREKAVDKILEALNNNTVKLDQLLGLQN